ncbi:MAG: hypothetical protein HC927_10940 [Deltaproteobacteria bacterium]|nr:hypothetical protein [Deltaproteobacteria bacterium]
MRHVYALFDSRTAATRAYEEVQQRGCGGEHCSVLMQRDLLDEEELTLSETAAREGAGKGAVIAGATCAVIAGLIALPGGLLGIGPLAATLFGGAWGATFGGLLGSISGASDPDKTLRKIEAEVNAGKVLLAVETDDPELERVCQEVFASQGGKQVT